MAKDFGVVKTRAIATSAMREATNSDILLDRIARTSGIEVEIISRGSQIFSELLGKFSSPRVIVVSAFLKLLCEIVSQLANRFRQDIASS